MRNPGVYPLAVLQVTPDFPLTLLAPTRGPADLSGMTAVTLQFDFAYGQGGTSAFAIVATTLDGGSTWLHIARVNFATVTRRVICNLEGLLSKGITDYADLTGEGVNDGVLGAALAVLFESAGNYSNTTLGVRASVR